MKKLIATVAVVCFACSSDDASNPDSGTPSDSGKDSTTTSDANPSDAGPTSDASNDGGMPAGWLYTQGGKILVSTGAGGTQWMGRGVNMDDLFLCGYNYDLSKASAEATLTTIASNLVTQWKPTFIRVSLGMASYTATTVSWLTNPAQYKTPMTNVINSIGTHPGVYVLVTLRSDTSMGLHDTGDPEPTGAPAAATDAVYVALVDTFAHSSFVLFGLSNEPGGNQGTSTTIGNAMDHAVGVIRAEEDKLGVPHHIVSVQGIGYSSDISFYATAPLAHDNVVYEVHGYPPSTKSYTYSNIPVIIGEYGTLGSGSAAFFADLETKVIPNLAWDFEPYSNCAPDLVDVDYDASALNPSASGSLVKAYLLAH